MLQKVWPVYLVFFLKPKPTGQRQPKLNYTHKSYLAIIHKPAYTRYFHIHTHYNLYATTIQHFGRRKLWCHRKCLNIVKAIQTMQTWPVALAGVLPCFTEWVAALIWAKLLNGIWHSVFSIWHTSWHIRPLTQARYSVRNYCAETFQMSQRVRPEAAVSSEAVFFKS